MTVYALDKLIAETRRLAAEYRRTTGKPLSGVSNEIAENDAARLLGLELCSDRGDGYDAVGTRDRWDGKRVQIKARAIFDESKTGQRLGQLKVEREWDSVILVLMDEDYEPYEIYEAEREDVLAFLDESSSQRKKRGAMSIARFKIIGELVWTRENGLEPEVWDNRSDGHE